VLNHGTGRSSITRCSRPLCSSQTTTRHHPDTDPTRPRSRPPQGANSGRCETRDSPEQKTQPPPPPTTHSAVSRDRARSLRTQQRAYDHHPTPNPPPHPPPSRRTGAGRTRGRQTSRRPNWSAFHPRAPPHTHRTAPVTGTASRRGRGSAPTEELCR
jgi:hypothetical protein